MTEMEQVEVATSKVLQKLHEGIESPDVDAELRALLTRARDFKLGWAALGEALLKVQQRKTYRNWGAADLKTFCRAELGLRWPTVEKLLRSTYYMQRHEPRLLDRSEPLAADRPAPELGSIDFLARGEEKNALSMDLLKNLHKEVFEEGAKPAKVSRLASAQLEPEARDLLGLKPPPHEDPKVRAVHSDLGTARRLAAALARHEAPENVQGEAKNLVTHLEAWATDLTPEAEH
jgi:hypothetical protein